jgi:hypothetical protein
LVHFTNKFPLQTAQPTSSTMAFLINKLASLVEPYVMPIVERNVVPDAIVRFGELVCF